MSMQPEMSQGHWAEPPEKEDDHGRLQNAMMDLTAYTGALYNRLGVMTQEMEALQSQNRMLKWQLNQKDAELMRAADLVRTQKQQLLDLEWEVENTSEVVQLKDNLIDGLNQALEQRTMAVRGLLKDHLLELKHVRSREFNTKFKHMPELEQLLEAAQKSASPTSDQEGGDDADEKEQLQNGWKNLQRLLARTRDLTFETAQNAEQMKNFMLRFAKYDAYLSAICETGKKLDAEESLVDKPVSADAFSWEQTTTQDPPPAEQEPEKRQLASLFDRFLQSCPKPTQTSHQKPEIRKPPHPEDPEEAAHFDGNAPPKPEFFSPTIRRR